MRPMKRARGVWFNGALALATASVAVLLVCCRASNDVISNSAKAEQDKLGIAETKTIAEEGFIYGLPIVMNYAVMYEYVVDRDSGQFKAPFNRDQERSPCLHVQGHRDRHAQQRHPIFLIMDGSARRTDGAVGSDRG